MCLPMSTLVHSRPYGMLATHTCHGSSPTAEKYVPATMSGPHVTRTSSSPSPRFFSRSGGEV